MLQLTIKLMNKFSYFITTPFIPGNKDYHSYCNPHLVYQTYPYLQFKKAMLHGSVNHNPSSVNEG